MARSYSDVVKNYRMVPEDFVKHLMGTLGVVIVLVLAVSIIFGSPEVKPLTIKGYSNEHPVAFEQMALRALDGQGQIANYGPPYNHGTGNVESFLQQWAGIIHPVNAETNFIIKPLAMAASLKPSIRPALARFQRAPKTLQKRWEKAFTLALMRGRYADGAVITPTGVYGPLPTLMNDTLALGQSGLMSGALMRNSAVVTRFDNQNYLLFLQGSPLQSDPATVQMSGPNWGLIHPAINGFPGAWWITIPAWIYTWPVVANSPASDTLAISISLLFWLMLFLIPVIPGLKKSPRYLGIHRLIWHDFYHQRHTQPAASQDIKKGEQDHEA